MEVFKKSTRTLYVDYATAAAQPCADHANRIWWYLPLLAALVEALPNMTIPLSPPTRTLAFDSVNGVLILHEDQHHSRPFLTG